MHTFGIVHVLSILLASVTICWGAPDLTVKNNCPFVIWLEARSTVMNNNRWFVGAPIPGYGTTTHVAPQQTVNYTIPAAGLAASRFWAKYGCDSVGRNCLVGDQMQYWGGFDNPNGGCPDRGCTPPVDSLFEATWGCSLGDKSQCALNPTTGGPLDGVTWFDTSHADGYTLPYTVDIQGPNCDINKIDGSKLDLARCPTSENLSLNGQYPTATDASVPQTYQLNDVSLHLKGDNPNTIVGCVSPCKTLDGGYPFGMNQGLSVGPGLWMCCPTPTPSGQPVTDANCQPANGCITPQQCRAGPIESTQYVREVRSMIHNTYTYAYDDVAGLHTCSAGTASFELTFCPAGAPSYPMVI